MKEDPRSYRRNLCSCGKQVFGILLYSLIAELQARASRAHA